MTAYNTYNTILCNTNSLIIFSFFIIFNNLKYIYINKKMH